MELTGPALICSLALEVLETNGWEQGVSDGPECCLVIALNSAFVQTDADESVFQTTMGMLKDKLGMIRSLADWNDAPGRTYEEVASLLKWGSEQT